MSEQEGNYEDIDQSSAYRGGQDGRRGFHCRIRAPTTRLRRQIRRAVRPEHAVEMYRLIPNAQLAILPGGDHFMLFSSPDKLLATLAPFLNAP